MKNVFERSMKIKGKKKKKQPLIGQDYNDDDSRAPAGTLSMKKNVLEESTFIHHVTIQHERRTSSELSILACTRDASAARILLLSQPNERANFVQS